jgi:hypothetical protein
MRSIHKPICLPLRRAASLLLFLAFQFSSAAHAACPALLVIDNPAASSQERLVLESCEVRAEFGKPSMAEPLVLQLQAPALARWRAALAPGGPQGTALLAGALTVRQNGSYVPEGPLLLADSAMHHGQAHWTWNAESGELRWHASLRSQPSAACTGIGAGQILFWIGAVEVAPGSLQVPWPTLMARPWSREIVPPECVGEWSLSAGAPAALHPKFGLLVVAPDAPDGAVFKVRAAVAGRPVEGLLRVTVAALHPLAGRWRQTAQADCGDATLRTPAHAIGEFKFTADGEFFLTWQPFESYIDYWGHYRHDLATGALALDITGGNRMPTDRHAQGNAVVDETGSLVITGLDPGDKTKLTPACKMVFTHS